MRFGEQLDLWRKQANVTGAELERRINKSRGYMARLISGDLGPTKDVCVDLGRFFEEAGIGVTTADVMAAAVPEAAGDWVRDWYERKLAEQRGQLNAEITDDELALLKAVRGIQSDLDDHLRGAGAEDVELQVLADGGVAKAAARALDALMAVGVWSTGPEGTYAQESEQVSQMTWQFLMPITLLPDELLPGLLDLYARAGANVARAYQNGRGGARGAADRVAAYKARKASE